MTPILTHGILAADAPLDPTPDEARRLLVDELAKPEYTQAQPTWFDRLIGSIVDWFQSLTIGNASGPPGLGILIITVLIIAAIVVAFLVFGLPRLNRRSTVTGSLFGEDDERSAADIRAAAERAAAGGDHATAIAEMFRAIARGLAERTVLTVTPGTTAHDFASRAAAAFPASAGALVSAATAFDEVRYLGRDGSGEKYAALDALERELRASRPVLEPIIP